MCFENCLMTSSGLQYVFETMMMFIYNFNTRLCGAPIESSKA